jgi:hypothetical protein
MTALWIYIPAKNSKIQSPLIRVSACKLAGDQRGVVAAKSE